MSRRAARIDLFKLVFELLFVNPEDTNSFEVLINENEYDKSNIDFISEMYQGIIEYHNDLNEIIEKNIVNYTLDRLYKVDLAILLIGVYELIYYKSTPTKIAVNEAVDLAKKFGTDKSFGFVNAVLGKVITEYKI